MRRLIFILVICIIAGAARADSVYMKDGNIHRGDATRKGDKVVIETASGTVTVPAEDVLTIVRSETLTGEDAPPDDEPLDETPADADTDSSATDAAVESFEVPATTFNLGDARRPEPAIFLLMRNMQSTPAGSESYQLREQIKQWRVLAHDRKRKSRNRWLGPEEIVGRRNRYLKLLEEAQDLISEAQSSRYDKPEEKAKKRELMREGLYKLRQTAQIWPSPLIRKFLMAVANYRSDNQRGAKQLFKDCIEESPYIAGFHQGLGMSHAATDRHLDALQKYLDALRYEPTSREALHLVREGMKQVPGRSTDDEVYKLAKELLGQYEEDSRSGRRYSRGTYWLLPGGSRRGWTDRFPKGDPLPEPPFDRFVFHQAIGVPVGDNVLMADAEVLDDALAAFVRTGPATVMPAEVSGSRYYFGTRGSTKELSSVSVRGAKFAPVKVPEKAEFEAGTEVTAYATNLFTRMGSSIHTIPGRIKTTDDEKKDKEKKDNYSVTAKLLPGESGGVVLAGDGRLVGYLSGKTDVTVDGGGRDRFVGLSQIADLAKKFASRRSTRYGYGTAKWNPPTREIKGRAFIIYLVKGEKFQEDKR